MCSYIIRVIRIFGWRERTHTASRRNTQSSPNKFKKGGGLNELWTDEGKRVGGWVGGKTSPHNRSLLALQ